MRVVLVNAPSDHASLLAERDAWLDAKLARRMLAHTTSTMWYGPVAMPLCVWLMWPHVEHTALLTWLLLGFAAALLRGGLVYRYRLALPTYRPEQLKRYFFAIRWCWAILAFHWGSVVWLFYGDVPLGREFILWLVLVAVGTTAVNAFATDAKVLGTYMGALLTGPLSEFLMSALGVVASTRTPAEHLSFAIFACLFFAACMSQGLRNNRFQREMLILQYENERLISSLDLQTQQKQDAMASRSRLLAAAAHDLRQPMHALSLYADWLRREPQLSIQVAPKIIESVAAMHRLFDGLFGLAELDREPLRPKLVELDLPTLLRSVAAQYEPVAQTKGLQFRLRLPTQARVVSDEASLRRVVGNFLDNAIKYTQTGGVLLVCRPWRGGWKIQVWDTGVGIAPEHQQAVFTEFYRVTEHAGTQDSFGLGLAIVQKLAKRMGANLTLTSRPGVGSRFGLILPAKPVPQLHAASNSDALPLVGG